MYFPTQIGYPMTESESLALAFDRARQYTKFYFLKLRNTDIHDRPEVNGKKLNSAYWLIAHLTMTENWLLLNGTGGEMERFSWAKLFNMGKEAPTPEECPPIEDILETSKGIHEKVLERLRNLTPQELDQPHKVGFNIGGEGTVRDAIYHAIRHESGHAGQLGLLCKIQGLSTV